MVQDDAEIVGCVKKSGSVLARLTADTQKIDPQTLAVLDASIGQYGIVVFASAKAKDMAVDAVTKLRWLSKEACPLDCWRVSVRHMSMFVHVERRG